MTQVPPQSNKVGTLLSLFAACLVSVFHLQDGNCPHVVGRWGISTWLMAPSRDGTPLLGPWAPPTPPHNQPLPPSAHMVRLGYSVSVVRYLLRMRYVVGCTCRDSSRAAWCFALHFRRGGDTTPSSWRGRWTFLKDEKKSAVSRGNCKPLLHLILHYSV